MVEKDVRYGDFEKFWSYFEKKEIQHYVEAAGFHILECDVVPSKAHYHTHPGIRLFCQKLSAKG